MKSEEIIIKRLTYIKQLFQIGQKQSLQHESVSVFSILTFHDSIEMFLKLLAEKKNIKSDKLSFIEYWNKISDLTLKESMKNLNARRVNIKHKGLLPAKSEIEISRVNTQDFFNQNTKSQFGISFEDLSLIELVTFSKVKEYLNKSVLAIETEKFELSIENVAYAFEELITAYESSKSIFWESPYDFGKKMRHRGSSLGFSSADRDNPNNRKMSEFIDETVKSISALQKATKILSLGFDYKEYLKFKILTPGVTRMGNGFVAEVLGKRNWNKENCQYCIDFVIDCSLKLQEFDFHIKDLGVDDELYATEN